MQGVLAAADPQGLAGRLALLARSRGKEPSSTPWACLAICGLPMGKRRLLFSSGAGRVAGEQHGHPTRIGKTDTMTALFAHARQIIASESMGSGLGKLLGWLFAWLDLRGRSLARGGLWLPAPAGVVASQLAAVTSATYLWEYACVYPGAHGWHTVLYHKHDLHTRYVQGMKKPVQPSRAGRVYPIEPFPALVVAAEGEAGQFRCPNELPSLEPP